MLEFILSHDNLPYFVCGVVVVMLGVIEMFARLAGASLVFVLDEPEPNLSTAEPSNPITQWLYLDRLPVLLWCVMALSLFALLGFATNLMCYLLRAHTLPQSISVWLVFPLTGLACHWLGSRSWWRYDRMMKDSDVDLSGSVAVMTLGTAKPGVPAEALVKDPDNHRHYVMVEPREGESVFVPGTWVVLLSRRKRVWLATRFEP
ncbi:hypothetical protein HR45_16630 [Shewanella mangrovi]|uniref:Inner membrane protein n=1 Tax=Shewanella mangrovi TaxID=1515746 RepID=A0A094JVH9_9GAMM|nr:OB-fold-containig protein [Shewanella mangrovi]KFZ36441.1 hypothetical protein HR45_16630 [Shewanella mangrovi]